MAHILFQPTPHPTPPRWVATLFPLLLLWTSFASPRTSCSRIGQYVLVLCSAFSAQPVFRSFHGVRFISSSFFSWASQVVLVIKNPPANAGIIRDVGLIPGLGRSPGGGHGNPLQDYLEKRMDRGAWQATVHWVTKSQTQATLHACMHSFLVRHCSTVRI